LPGFGLNAVNPVLFTDGESSPRSPIFRSPMNPKGGYAHGYWFASSTDGGATFFDARSD